MEINYWAIPVAAISALVVGFVWYNPKVFGTAWMKAAGMTEEKIQGANMGKIFAMALVFAILLAMSMITLTIHQTGAMGMVGGDLEGALPSYAAFISDYGTAHRTFGHGALHGFFGAVFIVLPTLGTNALFERKSAKYILINSGYWMVVMAIMGGIICGWH